MAVGAGATYIGLRSAGRRRQCRPGTPRWRQRHRRLRVLARRAVRPGASCIGAHYRMSWSPSARKRCDHAGITVAAVTAGTKPGGLSAPGVVEPNAYNQVVVTPLVGGRVTRVGGRTGAARAAGSDASRRSSARSWPSAQTSYISARAELEAHEQELARTEKLVEIGAASRQELERIHAEHTARRADVQSAAARLAVARTVAGAIEALRSRKASGAPPSNVPHRSPAW